MCGAKDLWANCEAGPRKCTKWTKSVYIYIYNSQVMFFKVYVELETHCLWPVFSSPTSMVHSVRFGRPARAWHN